MRNRLTPVGSKPLLGAALIICTLTLNDFKAGVPFTSENAIQLIEAYAEGDERLANLAMFIFADVVKPRNAQRLR